MQNLFSFALEINVKRFTQSRNIVTTRVNVEGLLSTISSTQHWHLTISTAAEDYNIGQS
jgi:hypothetical protein